MHSVAGLGDVSRETTERLEIFAGLLKKWTRKINLVAPGTVSNLYERHIVDSAQIFGLRPDWAKNWVDLGSGGGLPGAVIAILAAEAAPQLRVTCVESDQRKAVFLRAVSRETAVPFTVLTDRIESAQPLEADVLSARALAPLSKLLEFADRHLAEGGTMLFQKGAQHEKERSEAEKNWRFDREVITSCTDPNAVIYKIGALRRA